MTETSLIVQWRTLVDDLARGDGGPAPVPITSRYLAALIMGPIVRHPWLALALLLGIACIGWVSGYDVRR